MSVATSGSPGRRWLARLAFVAAAAAIAVPLAVAGLRSVALVLVGVLGGAACLAGVWWFLTHHGALRWTGAGVAIAAPATVAAGYASAGLVWLAAVCALLWWVALAAGRGALAGSGDAAGGPEHETPPPRRPFLIMNLRSGGGKVERFGLAGKARALGAEVMLLAGTSTVDVAAAARNAVRAGADLLGVAGGDGTQALVAGVAAECGVPFMVISAGTRNHFALDLGLDRNDPSACLAALTDGVELRADLGDVGGRTFVNNASFGAYAAVVRSPAYRDDKAGTALELLPGLLTEDGPALRVRAGEAVLAEPQAVLVSNNPYAADDIAGLGRRTQLDGGVLGVLAVTVRGAADAARLVRGRRSKALVSVTATEVVVDADAPSIPVAVDGEALTMATPVRCAIRPAVLRVRVPRHRPGVGAVRPDWARLRRLALSTGGLARR